MLTQRKEVNFEGQNIYIGLDVHLRSWSATILTQEHHHKTFSQTPNVGILIAYLERNFPGATYYSAYEAGFCGMWIHYQLEEVNIRNIVINPADIPMKQKDQLFKDDKRDSRKIARSLRAGELTAIHIPQLKAMEDRSLIRTRQSIVKDLTRIRQRVKSMLYLYGIEIPSNLSGSSSCWSRRFILWLKEDIGLNHPSGNMALKLMIKEAESLRQLLLEVTREIRYLSISADYKVNIELLKGIPGIGLITAMNLMTQLETIQRFKNTDVLAGYAGLVPMCHSSGEKQQNGNITFRGQKNLKSALIESAWAAIKTDTALAVCYGRYCKRMNPNKAIVKIARKLLNRIFYTLKNKKQYVFGVVN